MFSDCIVEFQYTHMTFENKNYYQPRTILVHKKGDKDNPANFRTITLESASLKIVTSCLRYSTSSFLSQNHLTENKRCKKVSLMESQVL